MAATLQHLHQLVDALPATEHETAAQLLEALAGHLAVSVATVSAVPGTTFFKTSPPQSVLRPEARPIDDINDLRGDFWPEDDGPDEFVDALRVWRREGR